MITNSTLLRFVSSFPVAVPWICILVLPACLACRPAATADTRKVDGDSYSLELFDFSDTVTKITAVNESGAVIGIRETADEKQTVFSEQHFFKAPAGEMLDAPLVAGFTNLELLDLSDSGRAVGYASRALGHPEGSLAAIVWDTRTGMQRLGHATGDRASHAQSISSDGTRIAGYTTGAEPARLRPCVWTWNDNEKKWSNTLLPTLEDYNPYLMASRAVISPDGKRVAGCITVAFLPNDIIDSSLFVWEDVGGQWKRRKVSDEQLWLTSISNEGQIVGGMSGQDGRAPCIFNLDGTLTRIGLLPDDVSGEAWGTDAHGTVFGFSEDAHGPEGGPRATMWKDGKTEPLPLPTSSVFSAAYCVSSAGVVGGLLDIEIENEKDPADPTQPLVRTVGFLWKAK